MANPSFQIDDEKLDEFDRIINIKKARGELSNKAKRSEVLRQLVDEYIEGNESSWTNTPPMTAD